MVKAINLGIGNNVPFSYGMGEKFGRGLGDLLKNLNLSGIGETDLYKQRAPSQLQEIKTNPLIDLSPGKLPAPVPPPSAQQMGIGFPTPITSPAYSQDDINKLFSDLPKLPMAIPDKSDLQEKDMNQVLLETAEKSREEANRLTDPKGGDKSLMGGAEAIENLMNKSIMDFVDNVRGSDKSSPKIKTIEKYKEEFAKATGIDVSGKVDKRDALMAFGAALLQNKAGKKFNLGKVLESVGSASEKAMPLLQKAKAEAKAAGASAGKYALEMRAADKAKAEKAMEREDYFIVPKMGGGVSGDIAGILSDKGSLQKLNKYELDKLIDNKNFSDKFTILPGSSYASVVEEALKSPDGTKNWDEKVVTRNLIQGVDDPLFSIDLSYGKSGGPKEGQYVVRDVEQIKVAENALLKMSKDNERAKEKFIELGILTADNRNVFTYTKDKVNSLASAFGIKLGDKEPESSAIIRILEKIAMKNAPDILGESGKTISDADRERVTRIVGELKALGDIRTTRVKIAELFNDIVLGAEGRINEGLTNLSRYSKENYGLDAGKELDSEEQDELQGYESQTAGVTA